MAKTFRKRGYTCTWAITDWVHIDGLSVRRPLEGHALKKALARFHSDAGTGPGWMKDEPRWWRNLYERKDRRETTRSLQRFMQDQEVEVQLHKKPRLDYWW